MTSGDRDSIYRNFFIYELKTISRALSDFDSLHVKIEPVLANLIIDIMKERFDYVSNPYPFLIATYVLDLPQRIDEFVTEYTDLDLIRKLKFSYKNV